ncbi:SH3 domain-containing protein [Acinetobacter sp.]|uniref:SH3 domain-containing protein n=1 Tax=Acinetobacter sp. TaxID=472 RepID=UPI002FC707D1
MRIFFNKHSVFKVFIGFFAFYNTFVYADFGFISDKDGFSNLREEATLSSQVIGKVENGEIVSCILEEETSNFCFVNISNGKAGYIYKNRINFFQKFNSVNLVKFMPNLAVYGNSNIVVSVSSKTLDKNKIMYEKKDSKYYIGNKYLWGTDNQMPTSDFLQLSKIKVEYGGKVIAISSNDLEKFLFTKDGLNGRNELADFKIYYKDGDIYIMNQFNSGGAGAYNLFFHIKDQKVVDRKVWLEEI